MGKTFISTDGRDEITRVSRWINIRQNYNPRRNNSLWDYVTDGNGAHATSYDFNPASGLFLDYFQFNGRNYALEQFIRLDSVWCGCRGGITFQDGKTECYICAYDTDGNIYNPLYLELDDSGERVRLYTLKNAD